MLGDFANVAVQDPEWAEQYTANKRKYVDQPALQSFKNQQDAFDAGYFNKNFASAKYDDGVKAVATGTAAHYPMLTSAISAINQNFKDNLADVGFFALPAQDAANTRMTIWLPGAALHPEDHRGRQAGGGQEVRGLHQLARGLRDPEHGEHRHRSVRLRLRAADRRPGLVTDVQKYLDDGKSSPALEFVSPIKGPNLEKITVEVGSGIKSGRGGRQAVRRRRQEAGPAAGSPRLVIQGR